MKNYPRQATRLVCTLAVSAALTTALAGCTTSIDAPLSTPPDINQINETSASERDALIEVIQAGAIAAVGTEIDPSEDTITTCMTRPDAVQFSYSVRIPGEHDDHQTTSSVEARWAELGIELEWAEDHRTADFVADEDGAAVHTAHLLHFEASQENPAHFELHGLSNCVDGALSDYVDLLGT